MNLGEVKRVEVKFNVWGYDVIIDAENNLRHVRVTLKRLEADEVKTVLEMLKDVGGYDAEISYITPNESVVYGKRFVIARYEPAAPPMRSYVFYSSYENSPAIDGIYTTADIEIVEKGVYPEEKQTLKNVPVKIFTTSEAQTVDYQLKSVKYL